MFKQILFCTGFSENLHYAFTYALNLAKTHQFRVINSNDKSQIPNKLQNSISNDRNDFVYRFDFCSFDSYMFQFENFLLTF